MANIETTLIRSGIGTKDSNAALAAEVFATLDATNGNSAQAKSLVAIIRRAESRLADRLARKAARKGASEQVGVTLTPEQAGEHAWPQASDDADDVPAPARKRTRKGAKVTQAKADAGLGEHDPDPLAPDPDFLSRMRAAAARNEAEGVRT